MKLKLWRRIFFSIGPEEKFFLSPQFPNFILKIFLAFFFQQITAVAPLVPLTEESPGTEQVKKQE